MINEAYDDVVCVPCDPEKSTPVVVIAPHETPEINFVLAPGGFISGRVTRAETGHPTFGTIDILDSQGQFIQSTFTAADGRYALFTGLPDGMYLAQTVDFFGLVDEVYDDIPCEFCDPVIGTPILVTALETTDIDFALNDCTLCDDFERGDLLLWSDVVH